jgi:hypothetical protein
VLKNKAILDKNKKRYWMRDKRLSQKQMVLVKEQEIKSIKCSTAALGCAHRGA